MRIIENFGENSANAFMEKCCRIGGKQSMMLLSRQTREKMWEMSSPPRLSAKQHRQQTIGRECCLLLSPPPEGTPKEKVANKLQMCIGNKLPFN